MIRRAVTLAVTVPLITLCCNPAQGQAVVAALRIELQNLVEYQVDTGDVLKFGTDPNKTRSRLLTHAKCLGAGVVALGDIVAVNGETAKGTYTSIGMHVCTSPTRIPELPPSYAIADTRRNSTRYETYEILQGDGTPVGTIMTNGLNAGGPPPPGLPAGSHNFAIVGGTGAFLGARGQTGNTKQGLGSAGIPIRLASITENPANRRRNGGGHRVFTLYVIPMSRPEIVATASGPPITHSTSLSPVTASNPAVAGETLSLFATGLGPTRPGLIPGQPFPSNPLEVVNSPLVVTVNGKLAQVLAAAGCPGAVDRYRVDFRVPPDTAKGTATIQVSAAWIPGPPVSIPVQ